MRDIGLGEPATASVIDFYARTHERNDLVLRTSVAMRAMRSILSRCGLSDAELLALIEASAVRHCAAVEFDFPRRKRPASEAVTSPAA
ncbi:hypothetical protein [Amaricoccus sp.]|uniref:hypothetical protein n=1 Tax=Amaricoccus sp. TaxID=1872485 RepID=UPI001B5F8324|nr:hypothetical protein [Amaricoccus sp.]MBP7002609.1 hypothetical protein [Amaricoccus sp.]